MDKIFRPHIIGQIVNKWLSKSKRLDHDGFFYFDNPIRWNKIEIDRIGRGLVYERDEILPYPWGNVPGFALRDLLREINSNNVYIYKRINNRNYRTREKKDR